MPWILQLKPGCEKESESSFAFIFSGRDEVPLPPPCVAWCPHSHTALLVMRQRPRKENDIQQEETPHGVSSPHYEAGPPADPASSSPLCISNSRGLWWALRTAAFSSALRWPPWSTPNCRAFQQVCMGGAAL